MLSDAGPANNLIGRARVLYALAGLELRRHVAMEDLLREILDRVPLTPTQAREVIEELAARRRLRSEAMRQRTAARNALWVERHRERAAANRPT